MCTAGHVVASSPEELPLWSESLPTHQLFLGGLHSQVTVPLQDEAESLAGKLVGNLRKLREKPFTELEASVGCKAVEEQESREDRPGSRPVSAERRQRPPDTERSRDAP